MPKRTVRYEIEPRERHIPEAKKPPKGERFPLIEERKIVDKFQRIVESVGYDRIVELKEEIRGLDKKIRELRAKEKELVASFGERSRVERVLEDLWEYFEKRYGDVDKFEKVIHQVELKGRRLMSLLITPVTEEYIVHEKEMYDPRKLETFLDFAKRLGILTDEMIDTVYEEIDKANRVIEKTAKEIEEVRKIMVKEPGEVDRPFLASVRVAGILDILSDIVERVKRWVEDLIDKMRGNDKKIENIIDEAERIVREVDEVYGVPVIGGVIADRVWEGMYDGIDSDEIMKRVSAIEFVHGDLKEGDMVCFRDIEELCGEIVKKRGSRRDDLEFDIRIVTKPYKSRFEPGTVFKRVMWWEVVPRGGIGREELKLGFVSDRIGYVNDSVIFAEDGNELVWKMFDEVMGRCKCEKKAVRMLEEAVERFEKVGEGWKKLPKGWTEESVKKFWRSLTGDVKHKMTKCIEKMEGKVDNAEAFCASIKDMVEGTTKWRGGE